MYLIVTSNSKLLECIKNNNGDILEPPIGINLRRYNKESAAMTSNKKLAFLALIDGAKVFETQEMYGVSSIAGTKQEATTDMLIDGLLESLNISRKYRGYAYIKYMLKCNINDDTYCLKHAKIEVYTDCAKKFNVSNKTIAMLISKSIMEGYRKDPLKFEAMFYNTQMNTSKDIVNAKNFIIVMSTKIRMLILND